MAHYPIDKTIQREIRTKMPKRSRDWLNSDHLSTRRAPGKHRVTTNVRADVYETVLGTQEVQYKGHVSILVQSAIPIAGGTVHASLRKQHHVVDERECDWPWHQSRCHLPTKKPVDRLQPSATVKRMTV
jgi:hypothetical protein